MQLLTCNMHSRPCKTPANNRDVTQVMQTLFNNNMQELVAGSSAFVTRPHMALFADFCRDEILHGLPEGVHTPLRAAVVGIQRLPAGSLTGSAGAQHTQARMLVVKVTPGDCSAGESPSLDKQHCRDISGKPHLQVTMIRHCESDQACLTQHVSASQHSHAHTVPPCAGEGCSVLLDGKHSLHTRAVAYCANRRAPLVPAWAQPFLGARALEPWHSAQPPQPAANCSHTHTSAAAAVYITDEEGTESERTEADQLSSCASHGGSSPEAAVLARVMLDSSQVPAPVTLPAWEGSALTAGEPEGASTLLLGKDVDVRAAATGEAVRGGAVVVVGGGMTAAALGLAALRLAAARVTLVCRAALVVQEFECEVQTSSSVWCLCMRGRAQIL